AMTPSSTTGTPTDTADDADAGAKGTTDRPSAGSAAIADGGDAHGGDGPAPTPAEARNPQAPGRSRTSRPAGRLRVAASRRGKDCRCPRTW
ncbi:MAG TPA: hypothetical protein VIL85_14050, partial [Thermomicrobiales bacterium]